MFGRGKRSSRQRGNSTGRQDRAIDPREVDEFDDEVVREGAELPGPGTGPYDVDALGLDRAGMAAKRLDFGSIMLPFLSGAELQVELGQGGRATGVHMQTQFGRITIAALAAPKSPGQWREMTREMSELLRESGQTVTVEDGTYGREVHASGPDGDRRFIGFDGYRWMIRAVATGPTGKVTADSPLVRLTRAVLSETAVVRGPAPHPARNLLPIVLPKVMVEQLQAREMQRRAQSAAANAAAVGVRRISPTTGAMPTAGAIPAGAIPTAAVAGAPTVNAPATGAIVTGPRTGPMAAGPGTAGVPVVPRTGAFPAVPRTGAIPTTPGTGAIPTVPGTGAIPTVPGTGAIPTVPGGRRGAAGSAMQQLG